MPNFMNNMMVKKFLARAHFRARACRIFCLLSQILMIFEFSKRNEIWRAPRAGVRARQNFFYHHILHEILHLLYNIIPGQIKRGRARGVQTRGRGRAGGPGPARMGPGRAEVSYRLSGRAGPGQNKKKRGRAGPDSKTAGPGRPGPLFDKHIIFTII